jgi:hypothetical protein
MSGNLKIAYAMNVIASASLALGLSLSFDIALGLPCGAIAFVGLNRLAERAFK